jgi:AcrR family transcriptional regulator
MCQYEIKRLLSREQRAPQRDVGMSRTRELVEEEILRVATECFNERGYQATTIEEIAARVEISRVTFYTYFKSKEELLQAIFHRGLQAYEQGLAAILQEDLPRREKLRRIMALQIASLTTEQPAIRLFFSEEHHLPPQLARQVQEFHRRIDRLLEQDTRTGIERGELIAVYPRLLMYAFMGMCNWVYRWYRPGGAITPDAIVDTFSRILESGCLRSERDTHETTTPAQRPQRLATEERFQRLEEDIGDIKNELRRLSHHLRLQTEQSHSATATKLSGRTVRR